MIASTLTRRLASAVVIAGALALGSAGFANAQQNTGGEWDIGAYDHCMERLMRLQGYVTFTNEETCCVTSGGQWINVKCVAPPAADTSTHTPPPRAITIQSETQMN